MYNGLPWPTPPPPLAVTYGVETVPPLPFSAPPSYPPLSCELPPLRRNRSPWRVPTMPPPCLASYRIRPMQERAGVGARDQQRRIPADRPAQRRYFLVLLPSSIATATDYGLQIQSEPTVCREISTPSLDTLSKDMRGVFPTTSAGIWKIPSISDPCFSASKR